MKPASNKASIIFISILFLYGSGSAQVNCVLKKEKDNIKIYSCKTQESSFNAIMAEFEVNSTVEKYISIILDVNRYKEWRHREINPRLLKKISDTELIYYTEISAPFPVSNRDLILHLKLNQDVVTKIVTVTLEGMADYLPMMENIVRVPKSLSTMTLTPINESTLRIKYFVQVDPGGEIPAWVANTFSTQAPYETFKNLIKKMEEK